MGDTNTTDSAKKSYLTPFNVITGLIVAAGTIISVMRFTQGLGSVTSLSDYNPWGIWIGFDLLVGVALAAGGYVTSAAVYIFGLKRYHFAVRPAVLTGFLGYLFVVIALLYDVGRPWRLPFPFFVQRGTTSLLFEVAACVALYLTVLFLEISPAALEWLGLRKARKLAVRLTIVLTILGVILSTLHQSSLGALFLIAPSKLHPLWYSPYLPAYFFVSSIVAGLSMVILESTLSHRFFHHRMDKSHSDGRDELVLGFGKAASFILAGYLAMKLIGIAAGDNWHLLFTTYGLWFMVELIFFVALPCFMYAVGARDKKVRLVQWSSAIAVLGIIINRFNVSLIAFNWHLPPEDRYFPHWMEICISVFIVTLGILVFRFIVTRMPVLHSHPDFDDAH